MWVIKTRKHVKSSFALIFYKKKKKKKKRKKKKKEKKEEAEIVHKLCHQTQRSFQETYI
jgi:hypothetical protein